MDWLSFGLAHEGRAVLAADVARREVPTCGPDEGLAAVAARLGRGHDLCAVINECQVVLGLLRAPHLGGKPGTPADDVMEIAVPTVRPSAEVGPLLERMQDAGAEATLVTRSDGSLYGLLLAADAERALGTGR
jgi:CBS domain-containing protein